MTKQRVLICGLGSMGQLHLEALRLIPQAEVAGVVVSRPLEAGKRIERAGAQIPVFGDLQTALKAVPCEIVDICLPTDLHAPVAVAALQAGRHVFCEKPIALSLKAAEEIRRARDKTGLFVQVGHCLRFWPEYMAFEQFFRSGSAGRLLRLSLQRRSARPGYSSNGWLDDPSRSLGAALDLHIHDTDFILSLLGTPLSVSAHGSREPSGWARIYTHYNYPGVKVEAEGGWDYPADWVFQMAFQAVFEKGSVDYDSRKSPTLRAAVDGGALLPMPFASAAASFPGAVGNISSLDAYVGELRAFLESVAAGRAPRVASLEQAIESLRVVLAEIQSADKGIPVPCLLD